jgi:hypothetical protein
LYYDIRTTSYGIDLRDSCDNEVRWMNISDDDIKDSEQTIRKSEALTNAVWPIAVADSWIARFSIRMARMRSYEQPETNSDQGNL